MIESPVSTHAGAHPRSRGEHATVKLRYGVPPGSSPLARGTCDGEAQVRGSTRLIPARAGNIDWFFTLTLTQAAHPRSRGEHRLQRARGKVGCGSSPLARGTSGVDYRRRERRRLIPARAGNIERGVTDDEMRMAHPRSRGEHSATTAPLSPHAGSSPLARGTWFSMRSVLCSVRLIPARAGNIAYKREQRSAAAAHPRSRGEHRTFREQRLTAAGSSPLARGTCYRGG